MLTLGNVDVSIWFRMICEPAALARPVTLRDVAVSALVACVGITDASVQTARETARTFLFFISVPFDLKGMMEEVRDLCCPFILRIHPRGKQAKNPPASGTGSRGAARVTQSLQLLDPSAIRFMATF